MNRHLIAVIADSSNGDDPIAQSLALAATARILEHGGRVLLSADAPTRLPVLFAAAESVSPATVETTERRQQPPIILAPFPDADSLEDRLFTAPAIPRDDGQETPPRTLLSELLHSGIVELPDGEHSPARRSFEDLLETLMPAAVLVIGRSARTDELRRASEEYHLHDPRTRLFRLDQALSSDWPTIEDRIEQFELPPRYEGEPIQERGDEDEFARVAFQAASEAARVLALEDVIVDILGDQESIAPDERV